MRIMRSLINICKSCIRTYVSTSPGRHLHQTHTHTSMQQTAAHCSAGDNYAATRTR